MTTAKILNKIKNAKNEYPECIDTQALASFTYKGQTVILGIGDVVWDFDGVTFILKERNEQE